MTKDSQARRSAEEYWTRHAEPELRRLVINAFLAGTAVVPDAFADWVAAMPAGHIVEVAQPDPARPAVASAATTGPLQPAQADPEAAEAPAAPGKRRRRPMGISAVAYEIVVRAGAPVASRALLQALRDRDGRPRTEQRDNTFLAAMRRLRRTGWLAFDGTHYSVPKDDRQPGKSGSAGRRARGEPSGRTGRPTGARRRQSAPPEG